MKSELIRSNVHVRKSPIHGYGVFAGQDFNAQDIIEECHTLFVNDGENSLSNYLFHVDDNISALPLGYGVLYNHSDHPNIHVEYDLEKSILVFKVLRPIKMGEEIFVSYGSHWFSERKVKPKNPSMHFKLRQMKSFFMLFLRFTVVLIFLLGLIEIMKFSANYNSYT